MLPDGFPALPDFDEMETGEATKEDVYATQDIIAHVQKTLKADKAYTSGESFIYNGVLYHATTSIAKDANIVLTGESANATMSSVIQAQIDSIVIDPYSKSVLLIDKDIVKTDINADTKIGRINLTSDEADSIVASHTVIFETYYKAADGYYTQSSAELCNIDHMKTVNNNAIFIRSNYENLSNGEFFTRLTIRGTSRNVSANLDNTMYTNMSSDDVIKIRVLKVS